MNLTGLGPYPDFLAFGLACAVTCLMIVGVKESALMNKLFTIFNIVILSFIIVSGATRANFANWSLKIDVSIFILISTHTKCKRLNIFSFKSQTRHGSIRKAIGKHVLVMKVVGKVASCRLILVV